METDYLTSLLHSGLDLDSDFVAKTLALQPRAVLARLLEGPLAKKLMQIFNQNKFWEARLDSEEMREDLTAYAITFPRAPPISLPLVGKLLELSTLTNQDLFQAACALTEYHQPEQLQAIAQAVQFLTLNGEPLKLRAYYGRAILKCLRLNPVLLAQLLRYCVEVDSPRWDWRKDFTWLLNILAMYPSEARVMLKSLLGEKDYNVHYAYTDLLWKLLEDSPEPVYQALKDVVEEEIVGNYYLTVWHYSRTSGDLEHPVKDTKNVGYFNYAEKERFCLMPVGWSFEYPVTNSEMGGMRFLDPTTNQFSFSVLLTAISWLFHGIPSTLSFGILDTLYSWGIDIFDESTWPASLVEFKNSDGAGLKSFGPESFRRSLEEEIGDVPMEYGFYLRLLMHEESKWGPNLLESPVFQAFLSSYEVFKEDVRALVDLLRAKYS